MTLSAEPAHAHGQAPTTAILLCNLGTPDAPTIPAVRRYLAEFLSDRRVVEMPRWLWLIILHGIILRVRPAKSAPKYASIWSSDGSPLKAWSNKQADMLKGYMGERGHHVVVRQAMRYGNPSISSVLNDLKALRVNRILVLPLYPQYSSTTTASVCDAVYKWANSVRTLPELRFVNHYHDDPGYIHALTKRVTDYWMMHGRPHKLVLSFHGLPKRTLKLGDPYHCECHKTARLLGELLGFAKDDILVTFQSRFLKAEWLKPYTEPTLVDLARNGCERVDVMCPGFSVDCLETLEEINQKARAAFLDAGGKEFHYIPCLNDQHEWIAALSALSIQHLQGWNTQFVPAPADLAKQRERALEKGAAK